MPPEGETGRLRKYIEELGPAGSTKPSRLGTDIVLLPLVVFRLVCQEILKAKNENLERRFWDCIRVSPGHFSNEVLQEAELSGGVRLNGRAISEFVVDGVDSAARSVVRISSLIDSYALTRTKVLEEVAADIVERVERRAADMTFDELNELYSSLPRDWLDVGPEVEIHEHLLRKAIESRTDLFLEEPWLEAFAHVDLTDEERNAFFELLAESFLRQRELRDDFAYSKAMDFVRDHILDRGPDSFASLVWYCERFSESRLSIDFLPGAEDELHETFIQTVNDALSEAHTISEWRRLIEAMRDVSTQ